MAHKVTLNWDAEAGAASFNVKRATAAAGPFVQIANVPTNTYVDADPALVEGKQYWYETTALNGATPPVESAVSNIVTITVPFAVLPAPTNLTATAA